MAGVPTIEELRLCDECKQYKDIDRFEVTGPEPNDSDGDDDDDFTDDDFNANYITSTVCYDCSHAPCLYCGYLYPKADFVSGAYYCKGPATHEGASDPYDTAMMGAFGNCCSSRQHIPKSESNPDNLRIATEGIPPMLASSYFRTTPIEVVE